MRKYFGTDGIRGKAFEQLNAYLAFKLGQGLKHAIGLNDVIIGYDTRESSPMLAHMLASGALSEGMNVFFAGICSTPMVAYYAKEKQMIGVMITASHNPYTDNGIKVFNKGYKTTLMEEEILETFIDTPKLKIKPFGHFQFAKDFKDTYLKIYEQLNLSKTDLKIAYDSANGANIHIAKSLMDQYAPNSIQLNHQPNGLNINKDCGSTHMNHLFEYVKKNHLDVGFSFDGDGDRVLMCDNNRIYDGDEMIYVIANYLKDKNQLKNNHVVLTKMSNPGILKAFEKHNILVSLTDVGDKYVSKELTEKDYTIGGENSGHIILRHLLHTGDGLLAAMLVIQILKETKKTIKQLTEDIQLFPYRLVNIKNIDKSVLNKESVKKMLKEHKEKLGKHALLLVRPSGTENLIRVTVSTENKTLLEETITDIINYIKKVGS